ncbi:MAG: hypothetical protein LBE37_03235 [Sphingobacterium sp.]|jgi:hypothetical protein|nr:hypothetical protein [Sphingobacterium sp.]
MTQIIGVFIPIALFICITISIYFVSRFKYDAITKLGGPIPTSPKTKQSWTKTGIVVIGFSIGLLLIWGAYTCGLLEDKDSDSFFIIGLISLVVGIAILIAQKIEDKAKQ